MNKKIFAPTSEEYKIIMRGIRLGKTWEEILRELAEQEGEGD
jgi:hypothetical protein